MTIGIAGAARSGKDTAGAFLVERFKAVRIAFADHLKNEVAGYFGLPEGFIARNKDDIRPLLVEWGRIRRRLDPDYWVDHAYRAVRDLETEGKTVVITDVRYRNEAERVLGSGGFILYVTRPGFPPANDEERMSLAALREYLKDSVPASRFQYVENSGSVLDFHTKLTEAARKAGLKEAV